MWAESDKDPPTTPSRRGPELVARPVHVDIEEAPDRAPSTRGRFLFALMRRLRDLTPHDLPAMPRAVLMVMADFADASGVAWPAVSTVAKTAGMSENTARRAMEALVEHGWLVLRQKATPRTTARYEVRSDGRPFASPTRGAALRGPRSEPLPDPVSGVPGLHPRGAAVGPQGCKPDTPGVQQRDLRGAAVGPDPHNYPPNDPHNYPPNHPPIARAVARGVGAKSTDEGNGQATLWGVSKGEPPPKARRGRPKRERPRWRDYADAFVAGCAAGDVTVTPLSEGETKTIQRVAGTHAKGPNGEKLADAAVIEWVHRAAERCARETKDPTVWKFKSFCDRVFGGGGASPPPARAAPIRVQPGEMARGQDPDWDNVTANEGSDR